MISVALLVLSFLCATNAVIISGPTRVLNTATFITITGSGFNSGLSGVWIEGQGCNYAKLVDDNTFICGRFVGFSGLGPSAVIQMGDTQFTTKILSVTGPAYISPKATAITITGTSFQPSDTILVSGSSCGYGSAIISDTRIDCVIAPYIAPQQPVTIQVAGAILSAVVSDLSITGPSTIKFGTRNITITGNGFQKGDLVLVNDHECGAGFSVNGPTEIYCPIDASITEFTFITIQVGGISFVAYVPIVITGPTNIPSYARTINITGAGFTQQTQVYSGTPLTGCGGGSHSVGGTLIICHLEAAPYSTIFPISVFDSRSSANFTATVGAK